MPLEGDWSRHISLPTHVEAFVPSLKVHKKKERKNKVNVQLQRFNVPWNAIINHIFYESETTGSKRVSKDVFLNQAALTIQSKERFYATLAIITYKVRQWTATLLYKSRNLGYALQFKSLECLKVGSKLQRASSNNNLIREMWKICIPTIFVRLQRQSYERNVNQGDNSRTRNRSTRELGLIYQSTQRRTSLKEVNKLTFQRWKTACLSEMQSTTVLKVI